jgi:hypothetical protein
MSAGLVSPARRCSTSHQSALSGMERPEREAGRGREFRFPSRPSFRGSAGGYCEQFNDIPWRDSPRNRGSSALTNFTHYWVKRFLPMSAVAWPDAIVASEWAIRTMKDRSTRRLRSSRVVKSGPRHNRPRRHQRIRTAFAQGWKRGSRTLCGYTEREHSLRLFDAERLTRNGDRAVAVLRLPCIRLNRVGDRATPAPARAIRDGDP